ncbi:MAG: DUF6781 family protein [Methylomonas sp.]
MTKTHHPHAAKHPAAKYPTAKDPSVKGPVIKGPTAQNSTSKDQAIKDEVREAVRSGANVRQKVKTITLKALTERQLDMDNIQDVVEWVSRGINEGILDEGKEAGTIFAHAASALDDALAIAAEATKLAIQEASSRVSDYTRHDFHIASKDLLDLESMFLNTLETVGKGNQVVSDIVRDFVKHARQSGTAVGQQADAALEALKNLPYWGTEAAISNTLATTRTLAQIGSGILSGIAESLQPPASRKLRP